MAASTKSRNHRLLEVMAVVLLGVATIGSAWCGYQASRWNGKQDELARRASDLQVDANRQFGLATQIVSYDSNMIAGYAESIASGNEKLQEFYRTTLLRPETLPLIDEWRAQIAAGQPPTRLLEDQAYLDAQLAPYRAAQTAVEASTVGATDAGRTGDDYVLTTVLLASALFFAGLTTSFRVRIAQLLLLSGAALLIAYSASRLADLPVA